MTPAAENYDNYYFGIFNIRVLIRTPRFSALELRLAIWIGYLTFYLLSRRRLKKLAGMIFARVFRPLLPDRRKRDEKQR
ncbi:MAG: hypothetical protein P9M08_03040 [Candidatus Erginobacter occultus]|nr:hypothetical protein [Candidatus Erginobacter occultus]